jgi:hypothetical protein
MKAIPLSKQRTEDARSLTIPDRMPREHRLQIAESSNKYYLLNGLRCINLLGIFNLDVAIKFRPHELNGGGGSSLSRGK